MKHLRKINAAFAVAVIAGATVLAISPLGAQTDEPPAVEFTFDTPPYPEGDEDSERLLETRDVRAEFQGLTCDVVAMASNVDDPSIHEGNDFLIRSNGNDVVIPNFEGEEAANERGGQTPGFGQLTLGVSASLFLRFGEDEISSGDVTVSVTCTPAGAPPIVVPPDAPRVDRPVPVPPAGLPAVATPVTAQPSLTG